MTLLFCSFCFKLESATIHAILVGDTKDETLGYAFEMAINKMHGEVETVSHETGLSLKEYVFIENDAKTDTVMKFIESLEVKNNDVVFVYFAVHGYRKKNKESHWPNLYFSLEKKGVDFGLVNKILKKKKPRFLLSMADSCNNYVNSAIPEYESPKIATTNSTETELVTNHYRSLFLDYSGSVLVSSSSPGEYSSAYPTLGGIWTLEFLRMMKHHTQNTTEPTWSKILNKVAKNVLEIRKIQNGAPQNAQMEIDIIKI